MPLFPHYSASKSAMRALTQSFAMEMAPHKITANAYAPGSIDTAILEYVESELQKRTNSKEGKGLIDSPGAPEDVAKCVSYLASPDSDYMTGQTLVVDGGIGRS